MQGWAQNTDNTSRSNQNIDIHLSFIISVPSSTPTDSTIYIAGNFPDDKMWRADAFTLTKSQNNKYNGTIKLPANFHLQFKITRGSWETVEKNIQGYEIPNREIDLNHDKTITITVQSWADQLEPADNQNNTPKHKSTLTGTIKTHQSIHSKYLNRDRTILVYLPPDYDDPDYQNMHYPVLYMHDGQNLFNAATSFAGVEWSADETAQSLITRNKIKPLIIIAINNTQDRIKEYTPTVDEALGGGQGDDYENFIINELKPLIDRTYRTLPDRDNTAVAGSSLGGLISLDLIWKHPEIFSRAAVISPSLFWNQQHLIREIENKNKINPLFKKTKIWIDIGTKEGGDSDPADSTNDVKRLAKALASKGLKQETNYHLSIIKNGQHNESAWAKRFDQILLYLYNNQ